MDILILLFSIFRIALMSEATIVIQTSTSPTAVEYNCDKLKFQERKFVKCACLEGIWAFYTSHTQLPRWIILGGESKCYNVERWVTRIKRISYAKDKSTIRKLKDNENNFLITNAQHWGLSLEGEAPVCLQAPGDRAYCIYKLKSSLQVEESLFTVGCSKNSTFLSPIHCGEFDYEPENVCELGGSRFERKLKRFKRVRRDDVDQPGRTQGRYKRDVAMTNASNNVLDEDFVAPEILKRYTGDMQITDSIADYIKTAASEMLELSKVRKVFSSRGSKSKDKSPVQTLLQMANNIAKITCPVISQNTFNIAMNSFRIQQSDRNRLKEPYVKFPAFQRIMKALRKCQDDAHPFDFTLETTSDACAESGYNIGQIVSRSGMNITLDKLPKFALADPMKHEPLIEIVWKTFLIAHSYCYRYFKDYFNDHHTFTVSVLPYFSNKIQAMWFIKDGQSNNKDELELIDIQSATAAPEPLDSTLADNPVYKSDRIWYGNLLGDTASVLEKIDKCYSASRIVSDEHPVYMYPWFMNRPPRDRTNEWVRKKRDTEFEKASCDYVM